VRPADRATERRFLTPAEEYLTRLEESGGKNLKPKRMHLRRHLIPYFGAQRVDQLKHFAL
jgi:hypothetical protein